MSRQINLDLARLFALSQPCKDCPFVPDRFRGLRPSRVREILDGLRQYDGTFHCHKTTMKEDTPVSVCAGSVLLVTREGWPNLNMQLAERLLNWEPEMVEGADLVFATAEDMYQHYLKEFNMSRRSRAALLADRKREEETMRLEMIVELGEAILETSISEIVSQLPAELAESTRLRLASVMEMVDEEPPQSATLTLTLPQIYALATMTEYQLSNLKGEEATAPVIETFKALEIMARAFIASYPNIYKGIMTNIQHMRGADQNE